MSKKSILLVYVLFFVEINCPFYLFATPEDSNVITTTIFTTSDSTIIGATISAQYNNVNNRINTVDIHGFINNTIITQISGGPTILSVSGPLHNADNFGPLAESDKINVFFIDKIQEWDGTQYLECSGEKIDYSNGTFLIFVSVKGANPYTLLHELGHLAGLFHSTTSGNFMTPPAMGGDISPDQVDPLNVLFNRFKN